MGAFPRTGPLPAFLGVPLGALYRTAIGRINRRFDRGKGVVTFDRPVISVGNLSVGGTGKTPLVRLIVRWLREAGHRPCIAMRGYGAGRHGSDEAAAYRREFPDIAIVAQSNRTLGLIQLFGHEHDDGGPHSDCIVLDDGFQHRQIARALDIVLLDATRDPFADRLLPAGWLREPVSSLTRAGAVIITHAESVDTPTLARLEQAVARVRGARPEAVTRHVWSSLAVRVEQQDTTIPLSTLAGKRVLAVCAIGNPGPFVQAVAAAAGGSGSLVGSVVLRDHDRYSPSTVRRLGNLATSTRAQFIVTTDKDWSKISHVEAWPCPVVRPRLEVGFDRGEDGLRARVAAAASTPVDPIAAGEDGVEVDHAGADR